MSGSSLLSAPMHLVSPEITGFRVPWRVMSESGTQGSAGGAAGPPGGVGTRSVSPAEGSAGPEWSVKLGPGG